MNGLYVFCFAGPQLPDLNGTGVDGQSALEVRRFSTATAVLAEVPVEEFCSADAERNLEDLAWLAPRALRHQEVIEQAMRSGPTMPVRFGTIFSSPDTLDRFFCSHEVPITDFLGRVAGHQEWSVKVWFDRAQARESLIRSALDKSQDRLRTLPPGRRYIELHKIRSEADKSIARVLQKRCRTVAESLSSRATSVADRPTRGLTTESGYELVRHWAFLVPEAGYQAFSESVPSTEGGISFQLTGPWPPYSFVPPLVVEAA